METFIPSYQSGLYEEALTAYGGVEVEGMFIRGITKEQWNTGVKAVIRYLVVSEIFERREFKYELLVAHPEACEEVRRKIRLKRSGFIGGKAGKMEGVVKSYDLGVTEAHHIIRVLGLDHRHALPTGDCIWDTPELDFKQAAAGAWKFHEKGERAVEEKTDCQEADEIDLMIYKANANRKANKGPEFEKTDWKDIVIHTMKAAGFRPEWIFTGTKKLKAIKARAVLCSCLYEAGMTYQEIAYGIGRGRIQGGNFTRLARNPKFAPTEEEAFKVRMIIRDYMRENHIQPSKAILLRHQQCEQRMIEKAESSTRSARRTGASGSARRSRTGANTQATGR